MPRLISLVSVCLAASFLPAFIPIACSSPLQPNALVWEAAPSADSFVESIGVCTHWSYGDTPYGSEYATVKKRLAQSGIRHIRDGYHPNELDLYKELGIGSTLIIGPSRQSLLEQLDKVKQDAQFVDTIEGPNEPNLFWPRQHVVYKGQSDWIPALRLWQDDLAAALHSNPALQHIALASPTPIFNGPSQVAPITSFDYLALHPYAGGDIPSASMAWGSRAVREMVALLGTGTDMKPLISTECGYHNALEGSQVLAGQQAGISEAAGGKYFPRLFAEAWINGFHRSFVYELLNEFNTNPADAEQNFGLLRFDLTPKPSFTAVSNTIAILREATWDKAQQKWLRPTSPERAFRLAITGPSFVHHLTLSRADGHIDLLLWQEVPSFDRQAHKDLSPAPVSVTVALDKPASACLYRPLAGTTIQQAWPKAASFTINVPDEVVIVRISSAVPAGVPPAPAGLTATTTNDTVTLRWPIVGKKTAGYVVNRCGRYVGAATLANGRAEFLDSKLISGLGFPYEIRAVGPTGQLSVPASITATTRNERPDLIVRSIGWEPALPKVGDEVLFRITIANIGVASTPRVTHGVAVSVDGKTVCWSDNTSDPLAPGAERMVTTNNGPFAKATWAAQPGTHHVIATVDDVNRIEESNKNNNTLKATLVVADR